MGNVGAKKRLGASLVVGGELRTRSGVEFSSLDLGVLLRSQVELRAVSLIMLVLLWGSGPSEALDSKWWPKGASG